LTQGNHTNMCVVERPATRPALKRCGRCGGALTLMTRAEALTSSRGQGLFRSRLGVIGGVRKGLPSLTIVPVVYILPDLILLITVPLLNFTFELISSTVDRGQVASESLPHCSLTLPLTCFQFPSNRFQSMLALPRFNVSRETVFCVRLFHHGSGLLATRIFVLCYRRHWWAICAARRR